MSKKQPIKNPSAQVKDWTQFIKNFNRYGEKKRQAGLNELGTMLDLADSTVVMPDPEHNSERPVIIAVSGGRGVVILIIVHGPFSKKVVIDGIGPKASGLYQETVKGATKFERVSTAGIQRLVVIGKKSKMEIQVIPVK